MKISAKKVKRLMGAKLMTQKELAQVAEVSRATITATLAKGSCSVQTAAKIAKALNVDPMGIMEEV